MRSVRRSDAGANRTSALVLALLLAATAALAGCSAAGQPVPPPPPPFAAELSDEFAAVVQDVLPSVVEISQPGSVGSGIVFDRDGHIVTNAHVVGTGKAFEVRFANSSTVRQATLVYSHPPEDLAVIKVQDGGSLVPARFGAARDMRVGDLVMAMGSPLGLESSVTHGVVSALGRTIPEPAEPEIGFPGTVLRQTIQTSAPINPGNSGGALVNINHEVVGIPTLAAVNPSIGGAAPGVGFAIPGEIANDIARQIVDNGRVVNSGRAAVGITAVTVTDDTGQPIGAGVAALDPNGPAAAAGLRVGDIITRIEGDEIRTAQDLQTRLAERRPGEAVRLTVKRPPAAEPLTITVTLGELPVT
ncbi:trypsin-like peptidase domain-containing protein [Pseudonocardia sp.]|jgi:S1-C subfamily serine protease|uniref:S1C family serine protease n=1 Tax=Pseudonocardia sp. TaxID=60912 RepID=UPI002D81804F|nr:trypsin-like peptidase domain-containing protein [Pseudonocardia sp.]